MYRRPRAKNQRALMQKLKPRNATSSHESLVACLLPLHIETEKNPGCPRTSLYRGERRPPPAARLPPWHEPETDRYIGNSGCASYTSTLISDIDLRDTSAMITTTIPGARTGSSCNIKLHTHIHCVAGHLLTAFRLVWAIEHALACTGITNAHVTISTNNCRKPEAAAMGKLLREKNKGLRQSTKLDTTTDISKLRTSAPVTSHRKKEEEPQRILLPQKRRGLRH